MSSWRYPRTEILTFLSFLQYKYTRVYKIRAEKNGTFEGVDLRKSSTVLGCLQSATTKSPRPIKEKENLTNPIAKIVEKNDRKEEIANLTGSAKPGLIVYRLVRGQEIHPFGCVDVLEQFVFHKFPLQSLPIDLRGFHCSHEE